MILVNVKPCLPGTEKKPAVMEPPDTWSMMRTRVQIRAKVNVTGALYRILIYRKNRYLEGKSQVLSLPDSGLNRIPRVV